MSDAVKAKLCDLAMHCSAKVSCQYVDILGGVETSVT